MITSLRVVAPPTRAAASSRQRFRKDNPSSGRKRTTPPTSLYRPMRTTLPVLLDRQEQMTLSVPLAAKCGRRGLFRWAAPCERCCRFRSDRIGLISRRRRRPKICRPGLQAGPGRDAMSSPRSGRQKNRRRHNGRPVPFFSAARSARSRLPPFASTPPEGGVYRSLARFAGPTFSPWGKGRPVLQAGHSR
jgi:hypothetical protein